jgi:hypothetical protein
MRERKSSSRKTQRNDGNTRKSKRRANPSGRNRLTSASQSGTGAGNSKNENS